MSSWCWCSTGWLTESSQLTTSLRLTHDWGGYGLNGGNSSPTGAQFDGNSPLMPSRWRLNLLRAMRCLLRSIKAACMMAAYQSTSHQWGSLALCCCTIYFKSQFHNFHCSASLRVFPITTARRKVFVFSLFRTAGWNHTFNCMHNLWPTAALLLPLNFCHSSSLLAIVWVWKSNRVFATLS